MTIFIYDVMRNGSQKSFKSLLSSEVNGLQCYDAVDWAGGRAVS